MKGVDYSLTWHLELDRSVQFPVSGTTYQMWACAYSIVHVPTLSPRLDLRAQWWQLLMVNMRKLTSNTEPDVLRCACRWEVIEAAAGAPQLYGASLPVNMTGPEVSRQHA